MVLFQLWGGSFYLLQKIFLSRAERLPDKAAEPWRVYAWLIYILGLPPWLWIFYQEGNWIAGAVELGGFPSMFLGLAIAVSGDDAKVPSWLDISAGVIAAIVGTTYSISVLGGIATFAQILELALAIGFLVGTYQLAKKRVSGYGWYVLMNGACAWLMLEQGYMWLFLQQLASIFFVFDARKHKLARLQAQAQKVAAD